MTEIAELVVYSVRHGERQDHIDNNWSLLSPTPYDSPLSATGHQQAEATGARICDLELSSGSNIDDTDYILLSSPFKRCTQTSIGIAKGFRRRLEEKRTDSQTVPELVLHLEPGLSELMSDDCVGGPVPDRMMTNRLEELVCSTRDIRTNWVYSPAMSKIPQYPESYASMTRRVETVLTQLVDRFGGPVSPRSPISFADQQQQQQQFPVGAIERAKRRRVLILVTHAAVCKSLMWLFMLLPHHGSIGYCSLTRARRILSDDTITEADEADQTQLSRNDSATGLIQQQRQQKQQRVPPLRFKPKLPIPAFALKHEWNADIWNDETHTEHL
ncbi:hypothetical protein GQ42DRAFT_142787 [Ramicandelaber brevisporus]|nr:hypothetical protein GQ42DRAFT_142787 [Ramicandelaber brevisporus]